jgi:hypothetical protein
MSNLRLRETLGTAKNHSKSHKAGLVGPAFPSVELVRLVMLLIADPECQNL